MGRRRYNIILDDKVSMCLTSYWKSSVLPIEAPVVDRLLVPRALESSVKVERMRPASGSTRLLAGDWATASANARTKIPASQSKSSRAETGARRRSRGVGHHWKTQS